MNRRLAGFALGASSLAIAAVQAADRIDAPCQRCERRLADNTVEHGVLGPNLEYGGADDAFRVTVDGAKPVAKAPAPAGSERAIDVALAAAKVDVQVTALHA